MRTNRRTSLRTASVSIIGLLLIVGSAACTEESDPAGPLAGARAEDSEIRLNAIPTIGIRDIVSGREAAWAAKDAEAYASAFATDLRFVSPTGALVFGRDAFRATHVFLFSGPFAGSTATLAVREIQFLTGTIAIVYLDLAITGYAFLPPGVRVPADGVARARITWVVEKRAGEWQIVFMQNTSQ